MLHNMSRYEAVRIGTDVSFVRFCKFWHPPLELFGVHVRSNKIWFIRNRSFQSDPLHESSRTEGKVLLKDLLLKFQSFHLINLLCDRRFGIYSMSCVNHFYGHFWKLQSKFTVIACKRLHLCSTEEYRSYTVGL